MRQLKIAAVLIVAIALQSALRAVWQPLAYVDLTLVLVVHFALQREPLNALFVAAAAGLTLDALGGGLLGAGGFSKVRSEERRVGKGCGTEGVEGWWTER